MDPPVVPADRLDDWHRVEHATERPFAAGPVSVAATTVRYERPAEQPPAPFFFASRLAIRPETSPNRALTRLVERRARAGFRDRLADRDIEGVESHGERRIGIKDPAASRATLVTYRGQAVIEPVEDAPSETGTSTPGRVPVEALLAVWTADDYLLAGGGYPLDDGAEEARRTLLRLVRRVRG